MRAGRPPGAGGATQLRLDRQPYKARCRRRFSLEPPATREDEFYGDRGGTVKDPFGNQWHLATHIEDVPPDDTERRAAAMARAG